MSSSCLMQYLRALDATLPEPFFARKQDGSRLFPDTDELDFEGMALLVDLQEDASDDEELEEAAGLDGKEHGDVEAAGSQRGAKREVSYQYFVDHMWRQISTKEERLRLKAPLVYQEIVSYIKGSAGAQSSETGKLSLEQYLEVGRKRAPNFVDMRPAVFPISERYEKLKLRLRANGYRGTPLHNLYRDEVQDFAQAKLLMDLRVVSDPNGLFYCGDTCQTIARGIGFRFADIQTLFHDEAERRKEAGGEAAAVRIGLPAIEHLRVNYRTHSGILDVAASVVDLLKRFFPQHMDKLAREKAFFVGPPPLLLMSAIDSNDLSILLSGADRKASQVEIELEFDDVILHDFFNDSPANVEWRVLMSYLEELEEGGATPHGQPLHQVAAEPREEGALRRLEFDPRTHVLLCEELKHLYTAITRAKNNVVMFDRNPDKRAPFFHYLRRLNMARVVRRSLLNDGADATKFGLSQAKSSPAEWANRGANLLANSHFELAVQCFQQAGDPVRAQMALARAAYKDWQTASRRSPKSRELLFEAAYGLLAAAAKADRAPTEVPAAERDKWLRISANMFARAGEWAIAGGILLKMGQWQKAKTAFANAGDPRKAAECCEAEAAAHREANNAAAAMQALADASRHYKDAKLFLECLTLLDRQPQAAALLSPQALLECLDVKVAGSYRLADKRKKLLAAVEAHFGIKGLADSMSATTTVTYRKDNTHLAPLLATTSKDESADGDWDQLAEPARRQGKGLPPLHASIDARLLRSLLARRLYLSTAGVLLHSMQSIHAGVQQAQQALQAATLSSPEEADLAAHLQGLRAAYALEALQQASEKAGVTATPSIPLWAEGTTQPVQQPLADRWLTEQKRRLWLRVSVSPCLLTKPLAAKHDFRWDWCTTDLHTLSGGLHFRQQPPLERLQNQNLAYLLWRVQVPILHHTDLPKKLFSSQVTPDVRRRFAAELTMLNLPPVYGVPCLHAALLCHAYDSFRVGFPVGACQHVLYYLECCGLLATMRRVKPGHGLAVEVVVELLETVASLAILGLADRAFLPDTYLAKLKANVLVNGVAPTRRKPAHERMSCFRDRSKVDPAQVLQVLERSVRQLNLMTIAALSPEDPCYPRYTLEHQLQRLLRPEAAQRAQQDAAGIAGAKQQALERIALLGSTLVAGIAVHDSLAGAAPRPDKNTVSAAWQVVCEAQRELMAGSEDKAAPQAVPEALKGLIEARKLEQLLMGLRSLASAEGTGVTEVVLGAQRPFDGFAKGSRADRKMAAVLTNNSKCPVKHQKARASIESVVAAPQLAQLEAYQEVSSEEMKRAAAAATIQEAWRAARAARQRAAKMRFLRCSLLFRTAVRRWRQQRQNVRKAEEAARLAAEHEKLRQAAQLANAFQDRYDWMASVLTGPHLVAACCPVCAVEVAEAGPAPDGPSGTGKAGLSAAAPAWFPNIVRKALEGAIYAPVFKPHKQEESHSEQLQAFQAFKSFYHEVVCSQLAPFFSLCNELEQLLGQAGAELDAAAEHEAHGFLRRLRQEGAALQAGLKEVEEGCAWAAHRTLLDPPLASVEQACQDSQTWLAARNEAHAEPPVLPEEKEAAWREGNLWGPLDEVDDDAEWQTVPSRKKKGNKGRAGGGGGSGHGGGGGRARRR
ncbi:hypothetical protein WJX72_008781 [[Myrmecia] bisecta]|uniref:Uncharacterized protein n=1 Tax=[Myrmecia] bisecta TaxID=41462 RepID=A0AAW1QGB9_9CHLO